MRLAKPHRLRRNTTGVLRLVRPTFQRAEGKDPMGILAGGRRRRWRAETGGEPPIRDSEINQKLWLLRLRRARRVRCTDRAARAACSSLKAANSNSAPSSTNSASSRSSLPAASSPIATASRSWRTFPASRPPSSPPTSRDGADLQIAGGLREIARACPRSRRRYASRRRAQSKDPFAPVIIKDGLDQATAFHLREQLASCPACR